MAWVTPSNVATGDVLTASKWNQDVVENTNAIYNRVRRYSYVTNTAGDQNHTATSFAAASEFFSTDLSWTADGGTYWVEFFIPRVIVGSGATYYWVHMSNGSTTDLGYLALNYTAGLQYAFYAKTPYAPSAGAVSVNFRIVTNAGTVTTSCGAGGAATMRPAWAAVYGPDVS